MKLAWSTRITTRHATVVFCMMLVLLSTVNAQKQVPTKNTRPHPAVTSCFPVPPPPVLCGASLNDNTNTTLCNDVGPCSGIPAAVSVGTQATLNLNGHKIFGTNQTGSVGVTCGMYCVITGQPGLPPTAPNHGPGLITGFDTGIDFYTDFDSVSHVHVEDNNTGIYIERTGTISDNVLRRNSCLGIGVDGLADSVAIVNNVITGSNGSPSAACLSGGVGIGVWGVGTTVQGNAVIHNAVGLYADLDEYSSIALSGNDFSYNSQQGAYIGFAVGITVSGNFFIRNGQDGLWLDYLQGNTYNQSLVQNNFAYDNQGHGITLTNSGDPGAPNQLKGNVALGNNTYDLFWDGLNTSGNYWPSLSNTCDASSPSSIVCQ